MRTTSIAAAAALLSLLGGSVQAQSATAPGQYLAATCANCHGTTGTAKGAMPSLAGQSKAFIVEQMKAFKEGKRPATVMHQLAKGYTDQQVELIADYFAQQKPTR